MDHIDFDYPPRLSVVSTDIPGLFSTWRIPDTALVYRVGRAQQNGGFGNPDKHPHVWAVALLVDGQWARVHNTRDQGREWSNLDRLEKWLREQGITRWHLVNDIDEVGARRLGEGYYVPTR
ncbi:MAG: hypothetical protein PVF80_15795 [Gammaproteobacteria bacterium]|jgi:hypothetical protein